MITDTLPENQLIQKGTITAVPATATASSNRVSFTIIKPQSRNRQGLSARAIKQPITGKYLIDIVPNGRVPVQTLQSSLQDKFPLLSTVLSTVMMPRL